jgi:hypothetical protein
MLGCFLYLLLILFLIRYNAFFGLFKDTGLNKTALTLIFFLKAMAIQFMYVLYSHIYGGIENFDSGVFYRDAAELNHFARAHPWEYIKAMLGLQDDGQDSFFFNTYTRKTSNWDNGRIRILFYNDNRVVIRLHSVLHFIAFQSYFVHALFSCFLSYIGLFWIYRSIRSYFAGKELYLFLILCLFPALWIHTGALLKEGIAMFVMGGMVFSLHRLVFDKISIALTLSALLFFYLSLLLKPYLLLYALICFALLFLIKRSAFKHKILVFFSALVALVFCLDVGVRLKQNRSLYEIAGMRQVVFSDAAKGGIFLIDSVKFIRLDYDTALVAELSDKKGYYHIKKNATYMFWEHSHQQDTLLCEKNLDTSSVYELAYTMPESASNLDYPKEKSSILLYALNGLYYTLAHPLFFNASSLQQQLASVENTFIVLSLLISLLGLIVSKRPAFPVFVFLCFALGECLLIAFTSPNTGAIVRYRSPAVVYILLCALYYADDLKNRFRARSPEK